MLISIQNRNAQEKKKICSFIIYVQIASGEENIKRASERLEYYVDHMHELPLCGASSRHARRKEVVEGKSIIFVHMSGGK
jgi:hypothetical protein